MAAKWKFSLLAISAVVLSACSSVAEKTPDEMYRYSLQRQFKQDSQYNFTGKIAFNVLPEINEKARQAALDKLIESETQVAEWRYDDEPEMQKPEKIRERAEKRLARSDFMAEHFINHVSVPFTGAYDLPSGQFEIVPEIRYETRNAISSMKLPMLIDAKNASLIIDPAAVSPFLDMNASKMGDDFAGEPINNRYVRITVPDDLRKKLPMKDLFMAFPKALDDAYATYDKSAFTVLPLNERAKQLGATHRIGIKSTSGKDDQVATVLVNSLVEQLAQKQKDGTAQSNVKAEDYTRFVEVLRAANQETEELSDYKKALKNTVLESEAYFNNQGRLLSYVQSAVMPDEFSEKYLDGKKMRVQYEFDMNYNKKPTFVIQPNETNTIDLKKVYPKVQEMLDKFAEPNTESSATENAETETESIETEAPQYIEWKK